MIYTAITAATSDMVRTLKGSTFWLVIIGVTIICLISGPFGTLDHLPVGLRGIYWGLLVVVAGLAGLWTHSLIHTQKWNGLAMRVGVSLVFGFVVFALVVVFSLALLEPIGKYPGTLELMLYSVPSATIILLVLVLSVPRSGRALEAVDVARVERPRLLDRLKQHCAARRVLSLSAQDHYVEVVTETGSELCLIRLADAIAEAEPEPGMRIHRSHWVAKSAIEVLDTRGAGTQVKLKDGRRLPVSQSRLRDLRDFLSG